MKKRILGVLLVAVFGTSAVFAKDFTAAQKSKVQQIVKDQLLDADSAKFTMPAYKGGTVYCGYVNSKNTYGGYAGNAIFQVFVASPTSFAFLGLGTADPENSRSLALRQTCAENGYTI